MRDLQLAIRALRAAPVVSAAAVLSLALGMGANTAIFGVVNALLLRSLPVPEPHRLVTVSSGFALNHGFKAGAGMNYDMWNRMNDRLQLFDGGFAWAPARLDLSQGGEAQPAEALFTSGGFFTTLGAPALLGRTFSVADDVRGGGPEGLVAVISYGLWQRRFGGAAAAIGAVLPVDGVPSTIIGVMPAEFFGIEVGQPFEVALPLAAEPMVRGPRASLHHPAALMLTVMLRLKPEQSLDSATAALRTMQPDILGLTAGGVRPELPGFLKDPYVLVPAASGTSDRSGLRRQYVRPLLTIMVVVVLVLLVACVNIANLLLTRAAARGHEMSVRLALGASRWRLARQLFAESLVLSVLGAGAGLLFAAWAGRALVSSLSTPDTRVALDLSLDWRVMAVTGGVAIATAILFGTGPALRAGGAAPIDALKQQGRSGSSRAGFSGSLIVLQVALSLVLLVATGLFVSTFRRLAAIPLGFEADRVLVIDVDTARAHADRDTRAAYYQQLVDAVAAVPGVARAAASSITPFNQATKSPLFADPGRVHEHVVTPDYFATYGIGIRAGRDFGTRDAPNAAAVVIVSESYVRKFLADRPPLGAIVDSGSCRSRPGHCAVIGVVTDAVFGARRTGARPTIYRPLAQSATLGPPGQTSISLSVRSTAGSPEGLAPGVAGALTARNGQLSFSSRPVGQDVAAALIQERLVAALSGFFGGIAVLLAALGLYSVTAYAVARRRTEIGIRLALGATPAAVIRMVLCRVAILTGAGVLAGVAASLWASRFVSALVYGFEPGDLSTVAAAGLTLAAVAALAGALPAVRASRIEPAVVLREGGQSP